MRRQLATRNLPRHNSMVRKILEIYSVSIENLTKEQYAGSFRPRLTIFDSSRDALNPMVNTETLRNRLWVIDHYKYRYGANHTFWVHTLLGKAFGNLNRYKFNYAVKAFLLYSAFSKYQNYRYVNEMSFLTDTQRA